MRPEKRKRCRQCGRLAHPRAFYLEDGEHLCVDAIRCERRFQLRKRIERFIENRTRDLAPVASTC